MRYYVYELINSLGNKPFYVGKGTGRRMYVHENRAKRGHAELNENLRLRNKIKSIWNQGGSVQYTILFETDSEEAAYAYETERINQIGLENLCNIALVPFTKAEVYKLIAEKRRGSSPSLETRAKISNTLKGHVVSSNTRQKISDVQKGKSKGPCSENRRKAISDARKKNEYPHVISPNNTVHSIEILTQFCNRHDLKTSSMSEVLSGKRKSHRGWRIA